MRNLCLVFAFSSSLALAAEPGPMKEGAKTVPDSTLPQVVAPAPASQETPESLDTTTGALTSQDSGSAADSNAVAGSDTVKAVRSASAVLPPAPPSRALFPDASLAAREYVFGILGQTLAGALGFFIGSAIETAISGEDEAHKGTLSFTGIRYDNFYGAFWGGSMGALMGSSLTVYFTGQSDEEDGGLFWTLTGTALAGAGALYAAHLMGVNDDVDWKPFLPLLAIPSLGGVAGFNISRWFSDRKRESIMGPDAGLTLYPPRLAWGRTAEGDRFHLQALNLGF